MKPGDIVKFKSNKCIDWGGVALIYNIVRTDFGTGQIYLINSKLPGSTIPWITRNEYIEVLIEG